MLLGEVWNDEGINCRPTHLAAINFVDKDNMKKRSINGNNYPTFLVLRAEIRKLCQFVEENPLQLHPRLD